METKTNKTVELVVRWGEFEARHPDCSIEDFCRHYLARQRNEEKTSLPERMVPGTDAQLVILIRKIGKLHMAYADIALQGTGITQMEEFGLLITLYRQPDMRKTDLIYSNIMVLSSGANMIQRLIKKKLIEEYADPQDKRSKRLKLTPEGTRVIKFGMGVAVKLAKMLMVDLEEEDKRLCIQLLKIIDTRYTELYPLQKSLTFEEIYRENTAKQGKKSGDEPATS